MKNVISILLLSLALPGFACQAECIPGPERLCPVDEAAQDAAFAAFRDELLDIVKRRDWDALSELVADDVHVSFGPDNGRRALVEQWRPRDAGSPFWEEFEAVLSLGGSFVNATERSTFCAPYVYTEFPQDRDPFRDHAVVGSRVPLRAAPDAAAEIVTRLDYALVRAQAGKPDIHEDDAGNAWIAARSGDHAGYLRRAIIRSPLDYRACFSMKDERWKLTHFIAGD